jgi:uncharacterized membrane protein (UPF0127 family)
VKLAAVMLLLAACSHTASQPRVEHAEPQVLLRAPAGELRVKVELARSEAERQRGLMFRQSLESGRGMLFLFEQPGPLKFWMKNTYIPLDLIFLDDKKRIVFIDENAQPLTLEHRGPDFDTQYVLEVPGGWSRAHGVAPGVEAQFLGID